MQVVALRLTATVPVSEAAAARRRGRPSECSAAQGCVLRRQHGATSPYAAPASSRADDRLDGPAIVEFPESTCVIRPGWSASIDAAGALALVRT